MTKQGISDEEHAALIARAAHKRALGVIDNTEMGVLANMPADTLTELRAIAANFESRARALASHQRSSHTADAAAKRSMLIQHNVWGAAYQYMIDRITALEHAAIEADHTARNLKRARLLAQPNVTKIYIRFKCPAKPPYDDRTNPRFAENWLESDNEQTLALYLFEGLVNADNATGFVIEGKTTREFILVGSHIEELQQRETE